jgi:hypothetical protein
LISLLVVELLRHSPLSLALTGKPRPRASSSVDTAKSQSSVPAEPIKLGAGRM